MAGLKLYALLTHVRWPGYRGKLLLFAFSAAAIPWALIARGHDGDVTAAAVASALFLVLLCAMLAPIRLAAHALAEGKGAELPGHFRDEVGRILGTLADLSGRVSSMQHRWVQRHPLTGLPTREFLLGQIGEDIAGDPPRTLLGVIRLCDHDRLSAFDTAAADLALKAFAERLVSAAGKVRPLAHVDRDSFAIWFPSSVSAEAAATEFKAICYALGAEIKAGELAIVPEIQTGAALYPEDGGDAATLVTRALVSLGKPGSGGAGADIAPGQSAAKARERFSLEQDLRQAIAREQLELRFQPVVDLARGRLAGAEALLRWRHPQAGMIPPTRFVPIMEETGLTNEVGLWTLNAACREARNWERRGLDGLKIAVNLSATQLRDGSLKQMIARTLERHQLRPQALELELTETAANEDAERTFALFGELRAMGISLAIDDFGSGYSSLSYVKNLPFDKLKIDREFVINVHERRDSQAICRSLIELTRGLGIKLLAEGVEIEEEVATLRSFGCTLFQGYFFSKPLTAEEFVARAQDPSWLVWPRRAPIAAQPSRMTA